MRFRKIVSVLQSITSCGNLKICIGYPKHASKHVKLGKQIKQVKHGKQGTRHDKAQHGKHPEHPGSVMSSKRLLSLTLNSNLASSSFVAQN